MPGQIIIEAIAALGDVAVRAAIAGPLREWKLNSFYEDLSRGQKRAFLEVACAAIVHDGQVSEREEKWLEKRREKSESEEEKELVDDALETVRTALPIGADHPDYKAFILKRAAGFETAKEREKVWMAAHVILKACGAENAAHVLFAEALGVSDVRRTTIATQMDLGVR